MAIRSGYNQRNFPGFDPNATSPQGPLGVGRFGQLDAVGAIVNEVYWNAATVQDLKNPTAVSKTADAPVSYPFLWNAPQQDKVQWLGIGQSGGPGDIFSLVRNVGEVVGVFGHIEILDKIDTLKGYRSTIDRKSLEKLEGLITTLWSPLWPEKEFGAIDRSSADKGAEIFKRKLENNQSCWDCHGEIKREDPNRSFKMTTCSRRAPTRGNSSNFNGRSAHPASWMGGRSTSSRYPAIRQDSRGRPGDVDDHERGHRHHPGHLHVEPADRSAQGRPVRAETHPRLDGPFPRSTRLGRSTASGRPPRSCTTARSRPSTPSSANQPTGPRPSAWASALSTPPRWGWPNPLRRPPCPSSTPPCPATPTAATYSGPACRKTKRKWLIEYLKTL